MKTLKILHSFSFFLFALFLTSAANAQDLVSYKLRIYNENGTEISPNSSTANIEENQTYLAKVFVRDVRSSLGIGLTSEGVFAAGLVIDFESEKLNVFDISFNGSFKKTMEQVEPYGIAVAGIAKDIFARPGENKSLFISFKFNAKSLDGSALSIRKTNYDNGLNVQFESLVYGVNRAVAASFDSLQLEVSEQTVPSASAGFPGDANGDGVVNEADLNIVGMNWLQTGKTWAEGDFTGDGIVNNADLNIVGTNYGKRKARTPRGAG